MIRGNLKELTCKPFSLFDDDFALITATHNDITNSMTISWGTIGTLYGKSVVFVFIKRSRYTHDLIDNAKNFTLSFLSHKYDKDMNILGTLSGKDLNKIEKTNLHYVLDVDSNLSYIKESEMVFKVKKFAKMTLDDVALFNNEDIINKYYPGYTNYHDVYVGEITSYLLKEEKDAQ